MLPLGNVDQANRMKRKIKRKEREGEKKILLTNDDDAIEQMRERMRN